MDGRSRNEAPIGAGAPGRQGLPSIDRLLQAPACAEASGRWGRTLVLEAARAVVDEARARLTGGAGAPAEADLAAAVAARVAAIVEPSLKPVFNLTGTVVHTNLGRAPLPEEALAAMAAVAARPVNLEYDLDTGRRGDRDSHLEGWICRLTGAEAGIAVNNNAAAVLLALNSLAARKEVVVSRGELVEIGGSFRLPDIMRRAGAKLHEVGTTNRTHPKDFEEAVGDRTGMLLKAHTSNYEVRGFTAAVSERDLAEIAHRHGLPFVVDLGSGMLVDLGRWGLPHEPTVRETIEAGADLVTFSGDKLLGGPQAGIIAGRADLVDRIRRNPMRRALRLDKLVTAALGAVLRLYADPDRLADRVPVLRLLTRTPEQIAPVAERVAARLAAGMGEAAAVSVEPCRSQIGSGALPVERLDSRAVVIRPNAPKRRAGAACARLAAAFRGLPVPVIGRIRDDALWLDMRCLEDEAGFLAQLDGFRVPEAGGE